MCYTTPFYFLLINSKVQSEASVDWDPAALDSGLFVELLLSLINYL